MKTQIVKNKKLRIKPNLENYERAYREFSWKRAEKEIIREQANAAYIAIDKHVETWRKNKIALFWEGDNTSEKYTFFEMSRLSNRFANVLKRLGIKKGDRCFIFLPRIPELYISFLGILKTGAIAGTMFAAFGPEGLKDRLQDSGAKYLVTDSELKKRVYEVEKELPELKYLIITDGKTESGHNFKEIDYQKEMVKAKEKFNIPKTKQDDYAFMLYTSGTTGKPKGVLHSHRAILVEHMTAKWVLDLKDEDVYWCTADPGWVTGIAYEILGSWSVGASTLVYEGRFNPEKWYSLIEKYRVSVWYTAPTAIRMLEKAGEIYKKYDLSSLRHLCSVGEPLNPEPIRWGLKAFKLPFHDNWWQTETGGILIANYPCMPIKLGSMGKPFPGIKATIVDDEGKELKVNQIGNLAIAPGWPSMMRAIWKNTKKYNSYFKKGWYITGDLAFRDKDGYFWFVGRADDVIKTSGERIGPFEVESALVEHPAVVEAGVIGKPDPLRGEIIKAFIILKSGFRPSKKLEENIKQFVKRRLAGHAYPREIEFVKSLPKTRSGKIARRVLKARELGLPTGDLTTIENY
ncbi:MAG: acetate--CoA ligase [Candidatus Aenigmatarchaeota archaeon]